MRVLQINKLQRRVAELKDENIFLKNVRGGGVSSESQHSQDLSSDRLAEELIQKDQEIRGPMCCPFSAHGVCRILA